MKLLRIKASHYRNCIDDISIDFVPAARKTEEDKTYELNKIDESLYTLSTTAVIGKNAFGKTSVLRLINLVYQILGVFQVEDELISISGTKLEIIFYDSEKLYRHEVELKKLSNIGKSLSFELFGKDDGVKRQRIILYVIKWYNKRNHVIHTNDL